MTSTPTGAVSYRATRLTVEVGRNLGRFRERYEHAVPLFPAAKVRELVQQKSSWQDLLDLMAVTSPLGFFIFFANDVEPTVRLAGDQVSGVAYLMGNSTIMERVLRRQSAILLYVPLHTVIWEIPGGPAYFSFDKPSDRFRSFADPDITETGIELDGKLAALLDHLGVAVPNELLSR
ncbi:MAG TPA: hypothetical protein VGA04_09690 [Streptosporangiaceae bacterium]